jgi:hypothetical protein
LIALRIDRSVDFRIVGRSVLQQAMSMQRIVIDANCRRCQVLMSRRVTAIRRRCLLGDIEIMTPSMQMSLHGGSEQPLHPLHPYEAINRIRRSNSTPEVGRPAAPRYSRMLCSDRPSLLGR